MNFDCDAVDKFGKPITSLPIADYSSLHLASPVDLSVNIRYKIIDNDNK